jgi:hypothetical protein
VDLSNLADSWRCRARTFRAVLFSRAQLVIKTASRRKVLIAIAVWVVLAFPAMPQSSPSENTASPTADQNQQGVAPSDEELAKERQDPIADLMQVPIVSNLDFGAAAGNGFRYTLTIEPVLPVKITSGWYLVTKPIFSVASAPESTSGQGRTTGSSDLTTEFYFAPQKSTSFIWGFGPVVGMPTGSDPVLGTGKWTLGPGVAIIEQTKHWTFGARVNHVWSFAGDKNRSDVSLTLLEPTVSYSWGNGWEVGLDSETTYDSNAARGDRWIAPLEMSIGKVAYFGRRPVSLSFGVLPYALAPAGFSSVGLSFTIAPLFPRE